MKAPLTLGLATAFVALSATWSLGQQGDLDSVMRVVASGVCPDTLEKYDRIKTDEYCAYLVKPPCETNSSDETCVLQLSDCWRRVSQLNREIFSYNNFVKKCSDDLHAPPDPKLVGSALDIAPQLHGPHRHSTKAQKKADLANRPN